MRFTSFFRNRAAVRSPSQAARARAWLAAFGAVGSLALGCQGAPVDVGDARDEPLPGPTAERLAGAVIDLGIDAATTQPMEGFSLPERVGARLASWSEGEVSTVSFDVQGGAKDYLVAFLAEPYHMLGEVAVGIDLNKRPLAETTLVRGWRGYRLVVAGDRIDAGKNQLTFRYSKTGRPSDFDPRSSDMRDLSVRFDQIQIQPITVRAEFAFGSKNALALAALGEGWARDPSDRGTGTWTVAQRALISFHLARSEASSSAYNLALAARTPRGVAERSLSLTLNGAPLGSMTFSEKRTTAVLDVPAERLNGENELALEFAKLDAPNVLDPSSKDTRLLGVRAFELTVAPKELTAK